MENKKWIGEDDIEAVNDALQQFVNDNLEDDG